MATYKISGVWKDSNSTITHYAIHLIVGNSSYRANKTSKADAVKLLSDHSNTAMTWVWNYRTASWNDGERVEVVNGSYLRSNPDNKLTDNLAHLINYNWL